MERKVIQFTEPRVAKLITGELEAPKAGEVQVKVAVSSISSGTERSNLIGDPNIAPNKGAAVTFPRTLGYSTSGTVTAVGEGVEELKVGDRVAMMWTIHASYVNIPAKYAFKLPDSVSFEDAALFHISIFPMAAIRKCHLEMGEPAIVMGLGVLGLMGIKLLRMAGAAPIIAVDPNPVKREVALKNGADYALDPYAPDFAATAKKLTNGGAKVGIEVTGIGAGLDGILDCMARFGRVALLGCTRNKDFTIDYYRKVHFPGITLVGAHTDARPRQESHDGWWTQADDMKAAIKLTEMGRLKLTELVEEVHSPEEATEVYTRLANEPSFPMVQFDWRMLNE